MFRTLLRFIPVLFMALFAATSAQAFLTNVGFSGAIMQPTQDDRLIITFRNDVALPLTNVDLVNALPAGLFISTPGNIVNTCGGTVTATNDATNGTFTIVGGAVDPQSMGGVDGECQIEVDVHSVTVGTYLDTINIGDATGLLGGVAAINTAIAQATHVSTITDITATLSLGIGGTVLQGTEVSSRTITLNNPNDVPLTDVAFVYDMDINSYNLAASGPATTTCGGVVTFTPKANTHAGYGATTEISITGATIPANGSCEIIYDVTPSRDSTLPYVSTVGGAQPTHSLSAGTFTSTEGATNFAFGHRVDTLSGIRVTKLFDGASSAELNTQTASSATLTIEIENFNNDEVAGFNLADAMPAGLEAINIVSNTCGGAAGAGASVTLTAASLASIGPIPLAGIQSKTCTVTAIVKPNPPLAPDSTEVFVNDIPAGSLDGYDFDGTSATLTVTDDITPGEALTVNKAWAGVSGDPILYAGDSTFIRFSFANSFDQNIQNIRLTDDLVTNVDGLTGFTIGIGGVTANSCGGSVIAVPGTTGIDISGINLAIGASCAIDIAVDTAGNSPLQWRHNIIPAADVLYDLFGAPDQIILDDVTDDIRVDRPVNIYKNYNPDFVPPAGITRLELTFRRYSRDGRTTSGINFIDNLPVDHTVAPSPDVLNECGGVVTAVAGGTSIQLVGGSLASVPAGIENLACSVFVNVQAPASTGATTNTLLAADVSAIDTLTGTPLAVMFDANDTLTRGSTDMLINKIFTPTDITAGGTSRVRVIFDNTATGAGDMTGVGLVDDFSATDLKLAGVVNPLFTDTTGTPNANGCFGGTFTFVPGGSVITLANATLDAGTTCYFEFDTTSVEGGTDVNSLAAGIVTSDQGATNSNSVSATLAIAGVLSVSKGFSPEVVLEGENSTLTIAIINPTVALNYSQLPGVQLIQDIMPAGMVVTPGTGATTCVGSTVVISGTGDSISLLGGNFPAGSSCIVTATVTAATVGAYSNTIPANSITTVEGGSNPTPVTAILKVIEKPTIVKTFSPSSIPNGGVSTVTFTLTNPNTAAILPAGLTGAAFSDTLVNMVVASPPNPGGTCLNQTVVTAAGGTNFAVSGINMPADSNCTVTFDVTSTVVGVHPNTTTGITTDQTPVGDPAPSVDLTVSAPIPLTWEKVFAESTVLPDTATQMVITITNTNAGPIDLNATAFTDNFPFGMIVSTPVGDFNTCGGTLTNNIGGVLAGVDAGIRLNGGTVPPNSSCSVYVNVEMFDGGGGFPETFVNTTSTLGTENGAIPAVSDSIDINDILTIAALTEGTRYATHSDNAFFIDSILGAGDTIAGQPAVLGGTPNVELHVGTITGPSGGGAVTIDANGIIQVAAGAPDGTYTINYEICQIGHGPADAVPNCAAAVELVEIATTGIVAGPEAPREVSESTFDSSAGNLLDGATNDALTEIRGTTTGGAAGVTTTSPATVAPGTGGNVDLTLDATGGPSGSAIEFWDGTNWIASTALTVNTNTGNITVVGGTPEGDYRIHYEICEDDYATNCATATEVIEVRTNDIAAGTNPSSPYTVNVGNGPVSVDNILEGTVDTFDGSPATVGAGPLGSVDLTITSITSTTGVPSPETWIAIDTDTGEITVAGGAPDGTYVITYEICEENLRTNCATATETITVVSNGITAGPEANRPAVTSPTAYNAGNALDAANDYISPIGGGAAVPAVVGTNVTISKTGGDAELTLNAAGNIIVAADTLPGTYTIDYEICEIADTTNCATATETVVVTYTAIVADTNPSGQFSAAPAATAVTVGNVLEGTVDMLNGVPATVGVGSAGNVDLTIGTITATTPGGAVLPSAGTYISVNPDTGVIELAAGAPEGLYTIPYTICEEGVPLNCATATETVLVGNTALVAGTNPSPEDPFLVTAASTDTNIGNILEGTVDMLNGVAATVGVGTAGSVDLTIDSIGTTTGIPSPATWISIDEDTGVITVLADAPDGTYTIAYTICEEGVPGNCASATESITVDTNGINAGPEADRDVTGSDAAINAGNALDSANDYLTIGGVDTPATVGVGGNVVLTTVALGTDPELSIDPLTGIITVAAGTPAGTYEIVYQICEAVNDQNCATATETVIVTDTPISAVGITHGPYIVGTGGTTDPVIDDDLLDGTTPIVGVGCLTSAPMGPNSDN